MKNNLPKIQNFNASRRLLDQYHQFIQKLDTQLVTLNQLHKKDLQCRPGCSHCCKTDRTVNLIEAQWLKNHFDALDPLDKKSIINNLQDNSKCPLLINEQCMLYPFRPVLCRSHGLPLLYFANNEPCISFCELNFINSTIEFTDDNILNMDTINAELLQLDQKWADNCLNITWQSQRIYIRHLFTRD